MKVLLLDDPLSALDHETAATIVQRFLGGHLAEGRTIILITHRPELCLGLAKQTIEIENGEARTLEPESVASSSRELSRIESSKSADGSVKENLKEQAAAAIPEKFLEDEKREHGGVKASVYWEYIKAGRIEWWIISIGVMILGRLIDVGETWFLKQWGESYSTSSVRTVSSPFDGLPSPETDIKPWLVGFFCLAAAQSVMSFISQCVMLVIVYSAGRRMFRDVMDRVSHATFRFYDVTPVGRLMNRMTSDVGAIDGNISALFSGVAWLAIRWISSIVIIASVTPIFLVFAIILTASFVIIFNRFLPTSQSLRRLEVRKLFNPYFQGILLIFDIQMVSLSPLMSNFGALVEGLTTVRGL